MIQDTGAFTSDMTVTEAVKATVSSKEFGADVAKIAGLAERLADPNVSPFDAARLAVAIGDAATKVAGIAGELGEAVPMLGAAISLLEIGHNFVLAWQRGKRSAQAAEYDQRDWTVHPSGQGGALVAADLPEAFDGLLLAFGAGLPWATAKGEGYVGGGAGLVSGALARMGLARDDTAANATYLESFMKQGAALVGPALSSPHALQLEFMYGTSLRVTGHVPQLEAFLFQIGKLRRQQRLKSQEAGAALLQVQLLAAYGAAMLLSKTPLIDLSSWLGETQYVERRARLACWLDSPLNSEPEGFKLRLGLLLGNLRTVTNARWGALQAAKKR